MLWYARNAQSGSSHTGKTSGLPSVLDKLGFPIGPGMVESACKGLITQRFKGTGMRWSEPGFTQLRPLRLAWVNGRFDPYVC